MFRVIQSTYVILNNIRFEDPEHRKYFLFQLSGFSQLCFSRISTNCVTSIFTGLDINKIPLYINM
jgi:hypothetical protein